MAIRKLINKAYYWYLERYVNKPIYRPVHVTIKTIPSPNFFKTQNRQIKAIVLHATEASSLRSSVNWFKDKASKASSHFIVDKDGTVVQMVDIDDIAWHAGKSEWTLQSGEYVNGLNGLSVGIELVNKDDGSEPYPASQVNACMALVYGLSKVFNVSRHDVVRHKDIAPGRKLDTNYLDFDTFKKDLSFWQEKDKACR